MNESNIGWFLEDQRADQALQSPRIDRKQKEGNVMFREELK